MNIQNDTPLFVGFGHRRRVGKDSLARLVRNYLSNAGIHAYQDAFALGLKRAARQIFAYAGLKGADVYEREPERREIVLPAIGMSPRDLWIQFGNKMREIVPDVWIRGVLDNQDYARIYGNDRVVLISDLRFPNEVQAIRERGGMVVKVTRSCVPESDDVADSALAGMPDEEWDLVINNDGDLDSLDLQADLLADAIRMQIFARRRRD